MTAKEKAQELVNKFRKYSSGEDEHYMFSPAIEKENAKLCAALAVQYIITSNPHSNPLNTDVYSTMKYWEEVKQEIHKL